MAVRKLIKRQRLLQLEKPTTVEDFLKLHRVTYCPTAYCASVNGADPVEPIRSIEERLDGKIPAWYGV